MIASIHCFNPLSIDLLITSIADLDPDQFNAIITKPESTFSMMHLNARSLNQNLTNLTDFLTTIDVTFSIIGISETWLQSSSASTHIDVYNFISKCRSDRPGGGVGLFIGSHLDFKQRTDLDFFNSDILESIFIEIRRPNLNNIIIGTIYRPPSADAELFVSKLDELLNKFSK